MMTFDQTVKNLVNKNPHLLVPWYLILSYAYYFLNVSLVADETYDYLCKDLLEGLKSSKIKHRDMDLCDLNSLSAGTAFHLKKQDYPSMARNSAEHFVREGYVT